MKLDRSEFTKAVKFLKPAMMNGSRTEIMSHVHVKIEEGGERCVLTSANGVCGKRVILIRPSQLELVEDKKKEKDHEYLIHKSTLEGFETLCIRHKKTFSSSKDQSLKQIYISADALESHKDVLNYVQPVFSDMSFPDVDQHFQANAEPVTTILASGKVIEAAIYGFGAECEMTFSGEHGAVYIQQGDRDFQAFFMPGEVEPDPEGDED